MLVQGHLKMVLLSNGAHGQANRWPIKNIFFLHLYVHLPPLTLEPLKDVNTRTLPDAWATRVDPHGDTKLLHITYLSSIQHKNCSIGLWPIYLT